ncbi:SAM-dependent methyltransferase [Propionibacteriaceae bacterium Y1923]|uniref:SAM-dependent methyltransferase n=1 Tax=Aestuariimicrobium sp. Y1814 TaxID=3418742 RepID=UPI003C1DB86B
MTGLSARLSEIVEALPLEPGMRVLEIGGAPGSAARAVAGKVGPEGHVMVIDRSDKGVLQIYHLATDEIDAGRMSVRSVAAEDFDILDLEPFDLAFAIRVGSFDGRHPRNRAQALRRIAAALTPEGRLFIDGGDPLIEVDLSEYRPAARH